MLKRRAKYRFRSAVTGQYVSAEYAAAHPHTTVAERVGPVAAVLGKLRAVVGR